MAAVEAKCEDLSTRPLLRHILQAGIQGWLQTGDSSFVLDPNQFHRDGYRLINQQNRIGWHQVLMGRFSWCWSDMQDDYCAMKREQGTHKRLTGQWWQTSIIERVWEQWYRLWDMRNADVHGVDEKSRAEAETREIRRELRTIYDKREQMEPQVQELLFPTLENHMEKPTWVTKNWLATNIPVIKASMRRVKVRAKEGVRSIRQYFRGR